MPVPLPQYDPNEDDETTQQPDQQQLDQMQLGDSVQQKVATPPTATGVTTPPWMAQGPAAVALQKHQNERPEMPHPSVWQRIGAGILGGAAGFVNTRAGRPGGVARPIDPTAAIEGVMGTTGYQQQLKGWTQQNASLEKNAQLEEQRRKDELMYREKEDSLLTNKDTRTTNASIRQANTDAARQRSIQAFQQDNPYTREDADIYSDQNSPSAPSTVPPPMTEDPQGARALDLPPLPGSPQEGEIEQGPSLQVPTTSLPWQGPTPNLPPFSPAGFARGTPAPGYQGPPRYAANPVMQKKLEAQAAADAKNSDLPVMTRELYDMYNKAGIAVPIQVGRPIPIPVQKEMDAAYDKRTSTTAAKNNPNQWLADMQSSDPAVAAAAKANHDQWMKDQERLRTVNSTTNNFAMPNNPAFAKAPAGPGPDEEYLKSLPPMEAAQVKMVSRYDLPVTGAYFMSKGPGLKLATEAQRYDPTFQPSMYDARRQLASSYMPTTRTGPGRNIVSLNTLMDHSNELFDNLKKMENGDTTAMNTVNQWWQSQTGQPLIAGARFDRTAVATEIATALKGQAPSQEEINHWYENLNPNQGPQQQQKTKQELAKLGGARLYELNYQHQVNLQRGYPGILSPRAKKFLEGAGVNTNAIIHPENGELPEMAGGGGGTVNMKAPNGQIKPVPADQVEHYKSMGAVVVQ